MLSMTREGPYLIFGNKGKLVAWTLHRFYVLKLTHPLLYDDDNTTHAANDIKRIFLIVESKILDHAGHTRKASRISKTALDNCGKGVGNFYLS